MDLNSVALFVEVVKAGSFSAAARHTGTPVATISRRISELEKQLGVRLLARSSRHLRMTDAGNLLHDYASRGLDEMHAGVLALENLQQEISGNLHLSVPPSFTPWQMLIQDFQMRYPNIRVELYITERYLDLVQEGVDVALRVGAEAYDDVVARKLFSYRHQLVVSPVLFENHTRPKTPNELVDLPCACWNYRAGPPAWNLGEKNYYVAPYLLVNDYLHLQTLVLMGKCVTELPPYLSQPLITEENLIHLFPEFPLPERELFLLYPSRKQLSRVVRAYIDYCIAQASVRLGSSREDIV